MTRLPVYRDWRAGFAVSVPAGVVGLGFDVEVVVPADTYVLRLGLAPGATSRYEVLAVKIGGREVFPALDGRVNCHVGRRCAAVLWVRVVEDTEVPLVGEICGITRVHQERKIARA